jgi:hypothetical protein
VAGNLSEENGGSAALEGGLMTVSNVFVGEGFFVGPGTIGGDFHQSGGFLWISNTLTCVGGCEFEGGIAVVPNIVLEGGSLQIGPSSAATVTNQISFQTAGTLSLVSATQHLAPMTVTGNSEIDFGSGNSQVTFADSSGKAWMNGATLIVSNWNGFIIGGGPDQLIFGNSSHALTSVQLQQIEFVNPSPLPRGNWPAKILPTGEVVPSMLSLLTFSLSGSNMVLQWPIANNLVLQSATNAAGPFEDISNALPPFTNDTSQFPRRFFRLRQQ